MQRPTSLYRTPLGSFHGVVWDFDGTLVDTRAVDDAAVTEIVTRQPEAASGVTMFWASEGLPLGERLRLAWPAHDPAELLPLFDQPVRPRVFPGIATVIGELRRRGIRQGVVSSRMGASLRWGLRACGLLPPMRTVVGLGDVDRPKPDPQGLLRCLRDMGVPPSRAIFIGDRDVDVLAGNAAGTTVWQAVWGVPADQRPPRRPGQLRHPREILDRIDMRTAATG